MHHLVGHAIVSADDRIADAQGVLPNALHNDRDWQNFQAALDRSALVMLGRASHEAAPNPRKRKRLVVSSSVPALEKRGNDHWFNPLSMTLEECLSILLPKGGTVAVVGGQGVFDLVGSHRFDEFHLARVLQVKLPAGRAVFSACETGISAQAVLLEGGLRIEEVDMIDPQAAVELTIFRRPQSRPG